MVNLTAADLERFMLAGAKIETEIGTAQTTAAACKLDAERYRKIRDAVEGNETRQLRFIRRFIESDTAAGFDNFVDNLGA